MIYLDMPEIDYYVRVKWISKRVLDEDVWKKLVPLCMVTDYDKIPPQYLNEECYLKIAKSEYSAKYDLHLIPAEKITEEILIEALASSFECLSNSKLDKKIFEQFDIDALKEKALVVRNRRQKEKEEREEIFLRKHGWYEIHKWYSAQSGEFLIRGYRTRSSEFQIISFNTFDEFYNFILETLPEERRNSASPCPLYNVNLMEYDFKDIDISKYDLTGCLCIPVVSEDANNNIDSSKFLPDNISTEYGVKEDPKTALVDYDNNELIIIGNTKSRAKDRIRVNYDYISDIHLNHRIKNQLGNRFSKEQVEYLFASIVKKIQEGYGITLIAGDTSEYFVQNELFYSYLYNLSHGLKVIVLGNHELWDSSLYKTDSPIDDVIDAYRHLFDSKENQVFLQNELLVQSEKYRYILSENEILEMNSDEIIELCNDAKIIILGGIGFTGYCQDRDPKTDRIYNAEYGLYRKALTTLEEDIMQSQRFEAVYDRIRYILPDRKVIVLTHTPKECWSRNPYVANWIYVNGHTHRNIRVVNEEKTIFADNQIGYHNENIQIKSFCTIKKKELFYKHLEDGIHEITVDQYIEFNQSKGINASIRPNIGKILMLKRKKLYMFLLKKRVKTGEKLYVLDGGIIHTADFDEYYYYENMDLYVKAVKSVFKNYWETQEIISKEIRTIGGEGTIHGCIIDIDYYNHAYLNPADGKLTFYYATSITDKYVYESIEALLQDQMEKSTNKWEKSRYIQMKKNYQKQISKKGDLEQDISRTPPIFVGSTDMYRVSRIIKRLQHVTDNSVIRAWHNGVLEHYLGKTGNQLMDFNVSFSSAEIEEKYEID